MAKSRSARGASHQPALMGNCLTISHRCLPCPLSRLVSPSATPSYDWANGGSANVFLG